MTKKILCLFLTLVMIFGALAVLGSCGGGGSDVCEHVDANKDNKCDECGEKMGADKEDGEEGGGTSFNYPWKNETLIFQMNRNTDKSQIPFGGERYLAGEDKTADEDIDSDVADRNTEAYIETKVTVKYQYWPDTDEYGWAAAIDKIYNTVNSNTTKDAPDIYSCFVVDMVGASLKGTFANLYSTQYGSGELKGKNYFEFCDPAYQAEVAEDPEADRGYMYDYMKSTTLSKHKMYVLASDYFLDMIRAFFVVPVNVALLEEVLPTVSEDHNEDGAYTIDDFYSEVWDKKWTYNRVADYSAAIYRNEGGQANITIDDRVGWAVSNGGLAASGMVYTTSITIVSKTWDAENNDYKYDYPAENEELVELAVALKDLFSSEGIFCATSSNSKVHGDQPHLAIRKRFCENKALFGDIILIGALEFELYQSLKKSSGFGVVPVPLYHEIEEGSDEIYLTSIHNTGRPGAIARNTTKFAACTAFLNYQSTHSTDILNYYYDYKLQYDTADGPKSTVEMLQYIRYNVRSAFDKTFEDAIGSFNDQMNDRWHTIMTHSNFQIGEEIRGRYAALINDKKAKLQNLVTEYDNLPG